MNRARLWDRYAQLFPPRLLRTLSLPIGRSLASDDGHRWESVRMLNDAFRYVKWEGVRGDYAEFGVYEGRTFLEAYLTACRRGLDNMMFHAYDSFEGLPEPAGVDERGSFHSGQFAAPQAEFEATIARIPSQRRTITRGYFEETLRAAPSKPIAIAWIDCDLYESTVPVLDFLTDQLQDGSVLIFDDWFTFHARPDKGEQLACAEWLGRNPDIGLVPFRVFHWAGQSFIVNRD